MKREGLKHPKTLDLANRLGISRREAVGLLTLLFDWAFDYAPQGDIGKWSDGVIEAAIEWTGEASVVVSALVDSGWLDRSAEHRLIVHDWPDHVPTFVRAKLKKLGLAFLKCYETQKTPGNNPEPSVEPSIEPSIEPSTNLLPSPLLSSNQTTSNHLPAEWRVVEEDLFKHGVAKASEAVKAVKDAGCSITQVQNVIEFWRARQPAWSAGALYERLVNLRLSQGFDQLWPPPSSAYTKAAADSQAAEKRKQQSQQRKAEEHQRDADKSELSRMEEVFGSRLNSASRSELKTLIHEFWPSEAKFYMNMLPTKGPPNGMLRTQLLTKLAEREKYQEVTT